MDSSVPPELPVELLCKIFLLLREAPIDVRDLRLNTLERAQKTFPWAVGLVCSHWMHIVTSYPVLWSSLCLGNKLEGYNDKTVRRLSTYLERSGNHPLDIVIGDRPLREAWKLLLSQSYRWRCADMKIEHLWQLDDLKQYEGKMLILEELKLEGTAFYQSNVFEIAPSLAQARLKIWGCSNAWVISWSRLTTLHMDLNTPVDDEFLTGVLPKLKNIEELHLRMKFFVRKMPDHLKPVPLNSLHTLTTNDPTILLWIEAPALCHLRLSNSNLFELKGLSFQLRRSFRSLRRLFLSGASHYDVEIITGIFDHVEDLTIVNSRRKTPPSVLPLSSHMRLPQLRFLTIGGDLNIMTSSDHLQELTRFLGLRAENAQPKDATSMDAVTRLLEKVTLQLVGTEIPDELYTTLLQWTHMVDVQLVETLSQLEKDL